MDIWFIVSIPLWAVSVVASILSLMALYGVGYYFCCDKTKEAADTTWSLVWLLISAFIFAYMAARTMGA
jgi:hypothetical protein